MSKQPRQLPWEPWDGEYIGNIWGWKFSFISLGIILFFLFIAMYRFATLDIKPKDTIQEVKTQTELSADSLLNK